MLSEPRFKQKWSVNPNGSEWSNNTTKFGSRMLEKMGWTKGKGLGANEDGRTEHIKVRKKADQRGVGFSAKDAHNWVDHQDDFTSLLADLNGHHGEKAGTTGGVTSLEERSKTQKRVHYHKFARGKDLSNYRQNDLDAIFGVRSSKSAPATPADTSDSDSSGGESTSSCPVVDKRLAESKNKKAKKVQSNQVTSTMSVQEYFAQRMALMKNRQKLGNKEESGDRDNEISSTTEDAEADSTTSSASCTQPQKRKKKEKAKSNVIEAVSSTNDAVLVESTEPSSSSIDNNDQTPTTKKKKSKKRMKNDEVSSTDNATSDSVKIADLVDSTSDIPIKKKKKSKKRTKRDDDGEFESSSKILRTG